MKAGAVAIAQAIAHGAKSAMVRFAAEPREARAETKRVTKVMEESMIMIVLRNENDLCKRKEENSLMNPHSDYTRESFSQREIKT